MLHSINPTPIALGVLFVIASCCFVGASLAYVVASPGKPGVLVGPEIGLLVGSCLFCAATLGSTASPVSRLRRAREVAELDARDARVVQELAAEELLEISSDSSPPRVEVADARRRGARE